MNSLKEKRDSIIGLTIATYAIIATSSTYFMGDLTLSYLSFQITLSKLYIFSIASLIFSYILNQLYEKYEIEFPETKIPGFTQVINQFDRLMIFNLLLAICSLVVLALPEATFHDVIFAIVPILALINSSTMFLYTGFLVPALTVQLIWAFVSWFTDIIKKIHKFLMKIIKRLK